MKINTREQGRTEGNEIHVSDRGRGRRLELVHSGPRNKIRCYHHYVIIWVLYGFVFI